VINNPTTEETMKTHLRYLLLSFCGVILLNSAYALDVNDYNKRISYCEFRMWNTWGGEISRLSSKLADEKAGYEIFSNEMYWAKQDISKQAYLPSDKVRDAYSYVAALQPLMNNAEYHINAFQWCIRCAKAQQGGARDCKDLP
jgi:hypothetical protein